MTKIKEADIRRRELEIVNARITDAELSMADHGCLTMWLTLEGEGWGIGYGGYCLGKGYLGADTFEGSAKSLEYIMRIMDTVGVERFSDLKGKYVRMVNPGLGGCADIIGNIIEDKWFSAKDFFKKESDE